MKLNNKSTSVGKVTLSAVEGYEGGLMGVKWECFFYNSLL